jgi:hypothetical protein
MEILRIWRKFWLRHRAVWRYIDQTDEGFWTDLEDVATQVRDARWTNRGAVVREFPSTQDAATQVPQRVPNDAATQTDPTTPAPAGGSNHAATQTNTGIPGIDIPPSHYGVIGERAHERGHRRERTASESRREAVASRMEQAAKQDQPRLRGPNGCWNCLSELHPYTRCDLPRLADFCYGCGARNVTVRTCRSCGPEYQKTKPYTGPRGPRNRPRLGRR